MTPVGLARTDCMERWLGATAAVLLAASVTACGGGNTTTIQSSPPNQARPEQTPPLGVVEKSVIPDDAVPTSWSPAWARFNRGGEDFRAPRPNSRRFVAFVDVSNCGRKPIAYGPRVQYRSERVLVTFFIPPQRPTNGSTACTLEAISVEKVVHLTEPIGTRDLYDGGHGHPRLVWRNLAAN